MPLLTKEALEKAVLEDIAYIRNYRPVTIAAKSADHFSKMTIIKPIALNAYPQIYVDLVQRFPKEEAARRLKRLGLRESMFLYATLPEILTKSQRFTEIFKEAASTHFNSKLIFKDKVKEDKELKSFKIEVEDCFFCSGITLFENVDIPYCIPQCGVFENLYNIKSLWNNDRTPRLIQIDPIKSAQFEGDTCKYQVVVID